MNKERTELQMLLKRGATVAELKAFLENILAGDHKVKVAGVDIDGIHRGKVISKDKFLSAANSGGFGMSLK